MKALPALQVRNMGLKGTPRGSSWSPDLHRLLKQVITLKGQIREAESVGKTSGQHPGKPELKVWKVRSQGGQCRPSCAWRRQLQRRLPAPHRSRDDVVGFSLPSTIHNPRLHLPAQFFRSSSLPPEGEEIPFLKHRRQIPAPSSPLEAGVKDPPRNEATSVSVRPMLLETTLLLWKKPLCYHR